MLPEMLLFAGDHDPQNQVGNQTRQTTWQEQDQEQQPEPERADAEEFSKTTTYTGHPPVSTRSTQRTS